MPPQKELHYFDAFERVPDPHRYTRWYQYPNGGAPSWRPDLLRRTPDGGRARNALRKGIKEGEIRWALRYVFGARTDRGYEALFPRRAGLVTGEATPGYAVLSEPHIASLVRRLPAVRLLYLLRDPVERAWSAARMRAEKRDVPPIEDWPSDAQIAFLRERIPMGLRHSDYAAVLDRWERHVPPDRLLVGFYDDVVAEPEAVLRSVYRFLGVGDDASHVPEDARQPRNARAVGRTAPPEAGRWLTERLLNAIERAHARFDNAHTANWLAAATRRLAS